MSTRSTASSSTEGQPEGDAPVTDAPVADGAATNESSTEPPRTAAQHASEPAAAQPDTGPPSADSRTGADLGRRSFFRAFSRQTVQAAGGVAGAVGAIRRGTAAAATELISLGVGSPAQNAERLEPRFRSPSGPPESAIARDGRPVQPSLPAVQGAYRSPYRISGDRLFILDQRILPTEFAELVCRDADGVIAAMRSGAAPGGPVLAQLAGYGLALTSTASAGMDPGRRDATLTRAAHALRHARPSSRPVGWATERILARRAALGPDATADVLAQALRSESDAIADEAMFDHARLGRHGAGLLAADRRLELLLHGHLGPLGGGTVGTGLAIVQALASEEREIRAWVPERRPELDGARLTAWELRGMDVPYVVVADAAVGWLFTERQVDAVLLGAERIAANGDVVGPLGGRTIASAARAAAVPIFVCAPTLTFDRGTPTGRAAKPEYRPADELSRVLDRAIGPVGGEHVNPAYDVVPGTWVDGVVTEEGIARAPLAESLAAAAAGHEARRAAAETT